TKKDIATIKEDGFLILIKIVDFTKYNSMKNNKIQISKIEHDLKERVKELECLYNISRDIETSKNLEETFEKITFHLKEGSQFPESVNVNLMIDGKIYGIKENRKTYDKIRTDIILNRKKKRRDHRKFTH
ncbi:MAG: hypothetical protein J7K53_06350, partial [Bacteroidales bacterium]|nr:hypothetical protein [Bacteroidales bacterium]